MAILKGLPPIHPGTILKDITLPGKGVDFRTAAVEMRVRPQTLETLLEGKRPINTRLARKLSNWSGTSVEFWQNLQRNYNFALRESKKATPQPA